MPTGAWDHFERGKDNLACCHCAKSVRNKGGITLNLMELPSLPQFTKEKMFVSLVKILVIHDLISGLYTFLKSGKSTKNLSKYQ